MRRIAGRYMGGEQGLGCRADVCRGLGFEVVG